MKTTSCSKPVVYLSLMGLLLASSGCMTLLTLDEAKGSSHKDKSGAVVVDEKSKPGYYALLPLTVAGDIVTAPFQLACGLLLMMSGIRC